MPHEVKIVYTAEDKASAKTKTLNDSLQTLQKQLVAAAAVAATFKKAFDFSYEGAQFIQTGQSFDMLMDKVGAAPGILDKLKIASRGTIDEMSLMSSTATLLAGASGQLATDLANATPELMEIAKAANKLNPSLGTTTFMYNSIATGIKRASPLILDNLGIVVKVGEANKIYADMLGKTVEQLTVTEEKQALLNATLAAGQTLLDQVGGNTESMTDSWERATARATDLTNSLKALLAKGLLPLLETAPGGNLNVADAMERHEEQVRATALSYDAYINKMMLAAEAANPLSKLMVATGFTLEEQAISWGAVTEAMYLFEESGYKTEKVLKELDSGLSAAGEAHNEWTRGIDATIGSTNDFTTSIKEQADALNDVGFYTDEVARSMSMYDDELVAVMDSVHSNVASSDAMSAAMARLTAQTAAAQAAMSAAFGGALADDKGLDDLILAHGNLVYVAASTTEAIENSTLAMFDAEVAAGRLAEAELKLSENSDPEQQAALEAAVIRARQAFRDATGSAEDLAGALTDGYTYSKDLSDEIDLHLTQALYNAAEAAGADALTLAQLALITGEFTKEQIEAALAAAATTIKIENLGRAVAEGKISIGDARTELMNFKTTLLEMPEKKTIQVKLDAEGIEGRLRGIKGQLDAIQGTYNVNVTGQQQGATQTGGEESVPDSVAEEYNDDTSGDF